MDLPDAVPQENIQTPKTINVVVDAVPQRVTSHRRASQRKVYKYPIYLLPISLAMYGTIIGLSLLFAAYLPLINRLERVKSLGPLPCNVTDVVHTNGKGRCDKNYEAVTILKLKVDVFYLNETVTGITGGELDKKCVGIDYSIEKDKEYYRNLYRSFVKTCYLDPENTDDIFLDLKDLEATSRGAIPISMYIFSSLGLIGIVSSIYLFIRQ